MLDVLCPQALRALAGPQGAASVIRANDAFALAVDDCVTDIDTVSDLVAARLLIDDRS